MEVETYEEDRNQQGQLCHSGLENAGTKGLETKHEDDSGMWMLLGWKRVNLEKCSDVVSCCSGSVERRCLVRQLLSHNVQTILMMCSTSETESRTI